MFQLLFGCVEQEVSAVAPAWRGAAPPGVSPGRSGSLTRRDVAELRPAALHAAAAARLSLRGGEGRLRLRRASLTRC